MAKPVVKWVGGKRTLLDELVAHTPDKIKKYYESMVGGGALFFRLKELGRIKEAKLSDLNKELIVTYRVIRDNVKDLINELDQFQNDHNTADHAETFYYDVRESNPDKLNDIDIAARFIYLNKAGFNGLYRVNRSGKFNVPFGHKTKVNLYDKDNLLSANRALQGVQLTIQDFEAALDFNVMSKKDFIYLDPPYWPKEKTSFIAYTAYGFDGADHKRMRTILDKCKGRGILALVSNASVPAVHELYKGFPISVVSAPRKINSDATKRGNVKEVIIRSKK